MEHYKDDAGVVFGDVNLREGRVTQSRDGTPQNPGAGGWPTLRYYNADTGPGGAPVERITNQKICDEFKIPQRMIDSVTTSRKVCDAVTKKGCDADEGLSCYKCAKYKTKSWGKLLQHLRGAHAVRGT